MGRLETVGSSHSESPAAYRMLRRFADHSGALAPLVPATGVGVAPGRRINQSEWVAYQCCTACWVASTCELLGASTNASIRPFGDQAGSSVSTPGAVGSVVQRSGLDEQTRTDLVSH